MRINVKNFKSIKNSGMIDLSSGITIFAGKNSVGKSALLQAIYVMDRFIRMIHPTEMNPQHYFRHGQPFEIELHIDNIQSLREAFASPHADIDFRTIAFSFYPDRTFSISALISNYWTKLLPASDAGPGIVSYLHFPEHKRIGERSTLWNVANETREIEHLNIDYLFQNGSNIGSTIGSSLLNALPTLIDIPAFRTIPPRNSLATEMEIHPDGRNIHNVLHTILSQKNSRLEPLQEFVRNLFPQYREIIAPNIVDTPNGSNAMYYSEIQLRDISGNIIPLSACGAGVGQLILLASLVILRSQPTIFLMDEPHSFLHPEAEREFVHFLKKYNYHYYFITTHSTTIINATDPNRVYLCTLENNETKICPLIGSKGLTDFFQEIGLKNADLAMASKILFVEGDAEALVMEELLTICGYNIKSLNVAIINIHGKDRDQYVRKINDQFTRLYMLPVPYLFLYDGDNGGKVDTETEKYLNVYELENLFLTNPSSILSAIKDIEYVKEKCNSDYDFAQKLEKISPRNIEDSIKEITAKILSVEKDSVSIEQIRQVKGSNVIKILLHELLGLRYSKPLFAKIVAKYLSKDDLMNLKEKLDPFLSEKTIVEEDMREDLLKFLKRKQISIEEARAYLA